MEELIIHSNRQRERTAEQRAREFKHLKAIEETRAKKRQEAHAGTAPGKAKTLPENLPEVSGDARDLAAQHVGWSGRTAEKAEQVIDAIDAVEGER